MTSSSSTSPSLPSVPVHLGKRNLEYACDRCRSKKIKCNIKKIGGTDTTSGLRLDVQNPPCSHCASANESCTYGRSQTQRSIPKKYVVTLENQWDSLTWLIPQIFPPTYLRGNPEFLRETEASNTPTRGNPQMLPLLPPKDLYQKLANIYFSHINIFWPLFHCPTFEADLAKERHTHDSGFAQVLLGICAVASRYSTDPRVLAKIPQELQVESVMAPETRSAAVWVDDLEGTRGDGQSLVDASRDSAGWKYYNRICDYHTATTTEITLTELQTAHLIYQFLLGMPDRKAGYVVLGAALRRAQAKGLHRNKNAIISLENELWKRAYWCLVVAERMMAFETTQAPLSLDQNIEVDLPLELDDEVWMIRPNFSGRLMPAPGPNKPSLLAIFNHYARFSSEFEKLRKPPLREEDMVEVFIKPYREWLVKTPPHLHIENVGLHAVDPIWEAQSKVLYMMYGFFGVCICAISTQCTETPFVDEVLKLVSDILASVKASQLTDTNTCRLCFNEHSSVYVTDVPSLICLATVTAIFVAHLRAKWRSSYQTVPNSSEEGQLPIGGEGNSKEAFYNDIVDTCWNILTSLQESWMTARKSLALIEDFINPTETEEMTTETESGESYH